MHLGPARNILQFILLVIGIITSDLNFSLAQEMEISDAEGVPLVEVEPTNIIPMDVNGRYELVPYHLRRNRWGSTFGLSFSSFFPKNHEPNFYAAHYEEVYGKNPFGLIEMHFNYKRNLSFGSLGIDTGAGIYSLSGKGAFSSDITLIPIRLGGKFTLDMLGKEPFVAPYIAGGLYTVVYREKQGSTSVNGNTEVAPYFAGGVMIQLDWIDRTAARISYEDSGIENSFFFVEGRMFVASANEKDPDFSNAHANAGFAVEF